MIDSYKKIYEILKLARKRLILKSLVNHLLLGVSGALFLGTLLALASRITPIYGVYKIWFVAFLFLGLALAITVTFGSIPSFKKLSRIIDSFGLKERVSTLLELQNEESLYKELLLKDTVKSLSKLDLKEHIFIAPNKRFVTVFFSLLVIFGIIFLIPDYLKEQAEKNHAFSIEKKVEEKKLEEMKKEVEKSIKLSEEDEKEIVKKLEELKKELKEAKESSEIDKAEEKFAKKLELNKDEKLLKDLEKLAENLKKEDSSKALAEAIKKEDKDKVKEELDKLKESAKNLDSKSKEGLKNSLANSAKNADGSEMKEALNELSEAVDSGNENAISKSVDNVKGTVNKALKNKEKNDAVASLQKQLQDDESQQFGQSDESTNGQDQQGQEQGQGSGQNAQGQGAGAGQGQGSRQGRGSGGNGPGGGGGAGNSGGGGDAGVNSYSGGGIASKDPSAGKEREYEKVFTPNNLGGEGTTSKLTGKASSEGSSESTISKDANATLGEFKPYNQVIGEYSSKAMEGLNSYEIPEGMMEVIKNYFTSLEE